MVFLKTSAFGVRFAVYARRVEKVKGVNSTLDNGYHMPMLDVEGLSLREVENEAARIVDMYNLGPAHIFNTGRPDSWHVYILTRCKFGMAMRIACEFRGVDPNHLVWSLKRGHFTLRFSGKRGRRIEWISVVPGRRPGNCEPSDLDSFVLYETASVD